MAKKKNIKIQNTKKKDNDVKELSLKEFADKHKTQRSVVLMQIVKGKLKARKELAPYIRQGFIYKIREDEPFEIVRRNKKGKTKK